MPEQHDRRVGDAPLRLAQEAAGIGTWDWDLVGGTIVWSPEMYRILGISQDETDLFGAWLRVLHPEDQAMGAAHARANLEATEPFSMEFRVIRPRGEVRWVLGRGTTVRDAAGKPMRMLGINMDITDRRRAEESLGEETRALETLNRVGTMLAAERDLERLVQAATDAATELTGAQFGAFFHKVGDGSGDSVMLYSLSGIARGAFTRFPMPRHTAIFGPTLSGAAIVRADDITTDPRFGHNAPYFGLPNGHPPVRSHLGVPVVTRSGEVLGGMFFGHDRAGVFTERAERLAAAIAAQSAVAIDNARLLQRAQRELTERTRVEDRLREFNESLEHRVNERTIALEEAGRRLIREAEERREAEAALLQAQKLEALGQLTGGVAHDFNNLLTAILGNLELAQARITEPKVRRHLATAAKAAERGAKLTQQVLAYSRRQRLAVRAVDLNAVVESMDDLLQRTLGGLVQVETNLYPGAWPASTDPTQIELVLLNLAINARDAMQSGGTLRIETRNAEYERTVLPPELSPGDYVRIVVSDTGSGMSPEVLERATEPFFTTKEVGKGSGLGLPQVYGVARQSGGTVQLSSSVGVGTIVEVWLPRAEETARNLSERKQGTQSTVERIGERLLVVDDDPDLRALAVDFLQTAGHSVTAAGSGAEGLALLRSGERIDLVLVDYAMPGMSGAEFVRAARQIVPSLPVIYVSGYADPERARMTDDPVLSKPYASADLLRAVQRALRH